MVHRSSIHLPSLVQIGLRTATRNRKSRVIVRLLFVAMGVAYFVSETCRDVRHFKEVELRHLLTDFYAASGIF